MQSNERTVMAVPDVLFTEGYIDADGFRIRYQEAGQGEPLVSLHGAGGLRLSRSHALLATRYRVIVFEVPGFGQSPANERSQSMADLAHTMAQAMTNLGLERFNLMGNSFGGKLALWLAVQQPERIQALVLVAPAALLGIVAGWWVNPRLESVIPFWVVPLALGWLYVPRTHELDDLTRPAPGPGDPSS